MESGLEIWTNNGTGGFTIDIVMSNTGLAFLAIGDLDGDDDLDILTIHDYTSSDPAQLWLNDGAGNFSAQDLEVGHTAGEGLALGDLDGDGDLDAFITGDLGLNEEYGSVPVPDEVWLNGGEPAPLIIRGTSRLSHLDTSLVHVFSKVEFAATNPPITVRVTPDKPGSGDFTPLSLTDSGFSPDGSGGYKRPSGPVFEAEAAIRRLVWKPAENRLQVGDYDTTIFEIEIADGIEPPLADNSTRLILWSVNTPPHARDDRTRSTPIVNRSM